MTEHLTISNEPPEHPGMNFALLRQEGIKHIERLAGNLWTDYNTHDPGITILETLCYAITDLSYRLSFEMKDLLAYPSLESAQKQFYTAREILTVNPLTINDYRKLLIDIDGVKNAWLEPIKNSQPPIYYDVNRHVLTFKASVNEFSENTQQINLNGLYRVLIEKDENVSDEEILLETIIAKLHQHRNLCEDFAEIKILPIEEITIEAEIEIEEGFDVNELMAKIYFYLDNFISPTLQFFSLEDLLNKEKTPEDIFEGVPLEHGFIDDEQLDNFIKKDELHTSELIRIILDIKGIKTVRNITISSNKSSETKEEWALLLDANLTPQLKDIDHLITNKNITFDQGQISLNFNQDKVKKNLKLLQKQNKKSALTTQIKDIPIPVGQYRELSDYESIQNEFPSTYGIGELGLPASASPKRKAQAKQLQAYLMFFDQLLANYFAQLDHVKDLLSWQTKNNTTYFSKDLSNLPGAAEVLKSDPNSPTDKWNETDLARRNRFLDHLMAQYCEKFTDYSLLLYDLISKEKPIEEELNHIKNKVAFLENYPQISAGRGKAFNYIDANQGWDTDNISGLKQRIYSLLGIPYNRQNLALSNESDEIEGFHLVEHILLRPRNNNNSDRNPNFLAFGHVSKFQSNTKSNKIITCVSEEHGLSENDQIQIFDTRNYNGTYSVINVQQDTFDINIETGFVESEIGQWVQVDRPLDPYSFQISFVFPDWPPRFKKKEFKQLIYNIISAEIPAHITPYFHWFDEKQMKNFETAYADFLNIIMDQNAKDETINEMTNKLIEILEIGSGEITPFNVLGYMIIGTNFVVS